MKECEKWLNRDGIDILRPELRHWKGICSEDGFEKGWRAALKWVLKDCKGSRYNTLNELEYFIQMLKIEDELTCKKQE